MVAIPSRPRWSATRERVIHAWSRMAIEGTPPTPEAVAKLTGLSVKTARRYTRDLRHVYGRAERKPTAGADRADVAARARIVRANNRLVILESAPTRDAIEKAKADYRRAWKTIRKLARKGA